MSNIIQRHNFFQSFASIGRVDLVWKIANKKPSQDADAGVWWVVLAVLTAALLPIVLVGWFIYPPPFTSYQLCQNTMFLLLLLFLTQNKYKNVILVWHISRFCPIFVLKLDWRLLNAWAGVGVVFYTRGALYKCYAVFTFTFIMKHLYFWQSKLAWQLQQ